MKSLLIYININNLITTQNFEPNFTRRPTISKQPATLLTKESEIEISNQQSKSEVKRNPAVGLDCGRSTKGLVAWVLLVPLLILGPFLHNQTPLIKERKEPSNFKPTDQRLQRLAEIKVRDLIRRSESKIGGLNCGCY